MSSTPAVTLAPPLAFAFGGPPGHGRIRSAPEDFQVEEDLGFAPDGAGQHMLLRIRKRGRNTEDVARRLPRHAGVAPAAVSYAGLKDRRAETTQWFSIDLAGRPAPDWQALNSDTLHILEAVPHGRKLRRGALRGNRFHIIVRDVQGERVLFQQRLEAIRTDGFPNYFGEQRFGRGQGNLQEAQAMFENGKRIHDRHRRGLYLSAARSLLFNSVLSERVQQHNWNTALDGEAVQLDGSASFFIAEADDSAIAQRLADQDIHPTGPLWGRGAPLVQETVAELEMQVLMPWQAWREGLERAGLKQERRALRAVAQELHWEFGAPDQLALQFYLRAGQYATALLRELFGDGAE
jgi:tRNA pseudouridine13 synthase